MPVISAPAPAAAGPDFAELWVRRSRPVIERDVWAITTRDHWVGAWRECMVCGFITVGCLCENCAQDRRIAAVTAAGWRPTGVVTLQRSDDVPLDDHDDPIFAAAVQAHAEQDDLNDIGVFAVGFDERMAVLWLPRELRPRARQVAEAIARITTARLEAGWSLAWALKTAALGRDQIVRDLEAHGTPMDRRTVAYVLDELAEAGVITRVGRLPAWIDLEATDEGQTAKTGANLWSLAVELRHLGERAARLLISSASLWVKNSPRRIEGALKWALENAYPGLRNRNGHWLACRCRDAGLTEDEASVILSRYVADVDQSGPRPRYVHGEASRTLRSVYRQGRRTAPTSGAF